MNLSPLQQHCYFHDIASLKNAPQDKVLYSEPPPPLSPLTRSTRSGRSQRLRVGNDFAKLTTPSPWRFYIHIPSTFPPSPLPAGLDTNKNLRHTPCALANSRASGRLNFRSTAHPLWGEPRGERISKWTTGRHITNAYF